MDVNLHQLLSYAVLIIPITFLTVALLYASLMLTRKRGIYYNEKVDSTPIHAPVHGLFVCYQCDTVFNTAYCPNCLEQAMIPLVRLTGSFGKIEAEVVLEKKSKILNIVPSVNTILLEDMIAEA